MKTSISVKRAKNKNHRFDKFISHNDKNDSNNSILQLTLFNLFLPAKRFTYVEFQDFNFVGRVREVSVFLISVMRMRILS